MLPSSIVFEISNSEPFVQEFQFFDINISKGLSLTEDPMINSITHHN